MLGKCFQLVIDHFLDQFEGRLSQQFILKQSFCWDRECLSANGHFGVNHFSGKLFSAFGGLSVILQGDHFSGKRL